jgi:hypothetical protein
MNQDFGKRLGHATIMGELSVGSNSFQSC